MTKTHTYIFLAAALMMACSKGGDVAPELGQGSVKIASVVATRAQEVNDADDIFEIPEALLPSADDFSLLVEGTYINFESGAKESFEQNFSSIDEFNSYSDGNPMELWSGNYSATLTTGGDPSIENETNACFGSAKTPFVVEAKKFGTELNINAALQNSIIRLELDTWFDKYFSGAEFTITTASGTEFTFDPFADSSKIAFVAPGTELTLSGVAQRVSGGSDVVFPESVIGTAKAGYMNTIRIETTQIGSLIISAVIDNSIVEIHEEEIELNPLED